MKRIGPKLSHGVLRVKKKSCLVPRAWITFACTPNRIGYSSLLTVSQGPLQVAGPSSRMASASEPCPSSSSDTGCPEEEDVVLTSVHVCYHKFESMCHQLFVLGLSAILIKLLIAVETSTSLTWEDTCHAHKHTM
jgi:hypothetical protein